ncbi:MAG: conjugative transposon protein TraM [Prevotella sp.]|nr:conjugative transposon protein TraM [Prevotella sp.]
MDVKRINFKDRKYVFPAILYPMFLFLGYFVIDLFQSDVSENDPRLATTDYLNSELPEANTDSILGGKLDNAEREYGRINDVSGIGNIESDRDSVNKKEDYESQYSEREAEMVRRQQEQEAARRAEQQQVRAMQNRVRRSRGGGSRRSSASDDFVAPVSDSEIAEYERRRRERDRRQIERDLNFPTGSGVQGRSYNYDGTDDYDGNDYDLPVAGSQNSRNNEPYENSGTAASAGTPQNGGSHHESNQAGGEPEKVVKKVKTSSDYFNTISASSEESKLIKAIIDEDVKVQEGSRVRLRLLDDVEIGDVVVRKGTYLYAQMSGFAQQRVKGNVQSVFFNDDIIRVSLAIYDTDGQEGLYVPVSAFKQTTKDIMGSATQGGTNIVDNGTSSTGIKGWASQAVQNASQSVMNTVNKVVRKNRVKLKYGTLVYLIDGSQKGKKDRK